MYYARKCPGSNQPRIRDLIVRCVRETSINEDISEFDVAVDDMFAFNVDQRLAYLVQPSPHCVCVANGSLYLWISLSPSLSLSVTCKCIGVRVCIKRTCIHLCLISHTHTPPPPTRVSFHTHAHLLRDVPLLLVCSLEFRKQIPVRGIGHNQHHKHLAPCVFYVFAFVCV